MVLTFSVDKSHVTFKANPQLKIINFWHKSKDMSIFYHYLRLIHIYASYGLHLFIQRIEIEPCWAPECNDDLLSKVDILTVHNKKTTYRDIISKS